MKKQFKAESKKLLDMMINSIYTHKEIFLRELISNASDAIDKIYYQNLKEKASGFNKDDYYIEIVTDKENRTLTIKDTGIGIDKSELPFIFDRFYRSDKSRVRQDIGGSGIGLSLVRFLVELFDGKIFVASEPRQGTTFTIKFPLQHADN